MTNEDTRGSDVSSFDEDNFIDLLGVSEAEPYEYEPAWVPTQDEKDPLEAQRLKYNGSVVTQLSHIQCINASRKVLLDYINCPFFNTLFPGCLTSIRSKNSANGRTICEISKVKIIGHTYEVDGVLTDKVLCLRIGRRFDYYQLTAISNFQWTEQMMKEYVARERKTKTIVTHGYVLHKRGRLTNAKAYILAEKAECEARKLQGMVDDLNSCLQRVMRKSKSLPMCAFCGPGPSKLKCPGIYQ